MILAWLKKLFLTPSECKCSKGVIPSPEVPVQVEPEEPLPEMSLLVENPEDEAEIQEHEIKLQHFYDNREAEKAMYREHYKGCERIPIGIQFNPNFISLEQMESELVDTDVDTLERNKYEY